MKGDKLIEVSGSLEMLINHHLLVVSMRESVNAPDTSPAADAVPLWDWVMCGCHGFQTVREQPQPWDLSLAVGSITVELWLRGTEAHCRLFTDTFQRLLLRLWRCTSVPPAETHHWWKEVLPVREEPRLVWLHHRPPVLLTCPRRPGLPQTPEKGLSHGPQQQ